MEGNLKKEAASAARKGKTDPSPPSGKRCRPRSLHPTLETAAPILFSNLNSSVLSLPLIGLEPAQAYVGPVAPRHCISFVLQRPGALLSNSGAASSLAKK